MSTQDRNSLETYSGCASILDYISRSIRNAANDTGLETTEEKPGLDVSEFPYDERHDMEKQLTDAKVEFIMGLAAGLLSISKWNLSSDAFDENLEILLGDQIQNQFDGILIPQFLQSGSVADAVQFFIDEVRGNRIGFMVSSIHGNIFSKYFRERRTRIIDNDIVTIGNDGIDHTFFVMIINDYHDAFDLKYYENGRYEFPNMTPEAKTNFLIYLAHCALSYVEFVNKFKQRDISLRPVGELYNYINALPVRPTR